MGKAEGAWRGAGRGARVLGIERRRGAERGLAGLDRGGAATGTPEHPRSGEPGIQETKCTREIFLMLL